MPHNVDHKWYISVAAQNMVSTWCDTSITERKKDCFLLSLSRLSLRLLNYFFIMQRRRPAPRVWHSIDAEPAAVPADRFVDGCLVSLACVRSARGRCFRLWVISGSGACQSLCCGFRDLHQPDSIQPGEYGSGKSSVSPGVCGIERFVEALSP